MFMYDFMDISSVGCRIRWFCAICWATSTTWRSGPAATARWMATTTCATSSPGCARSYDPTRWIDYQETTDELRAYLEPLAQSEKRLFKEEQLAFRRDCLRLLNNLCGPSAYLDKVRKRFSLERD